MSSFWVRMGVYAVSAALYGVLLYATPRHEFVQLISLFALLFAGYFALANVLKVRVFPFPRTQSKTAHTFSIRTTEIWIAACVFRLIAVFALPQLSDDYFRFVWDGKLLIQGENPFHALPETYMQDAGRTQQLGLSQELYDGLNSPRYYTIYPPVNQAVFALGAWLFPHDLYGSVVVMKWTILLAEMGSIWVLFQLLGLWGKPKEWAALYALNPLVIVELCGNLHFEAHMIFFLLLGIWLLSTQRWRRAIIPFVLSIGSKLLPLMMLTLLLRRLGVLRLAVFGVGVLGLVALMFLPLMDQVAWTHFRESVDLYFLTFEFNASLYYVIRWVGFQVKGYNIIGMVGEVTPKIVFVGIWLITLLEKHPRWERLPGRMVECLLLYFAFASIVHPWYIISILALSVLSQYRFALIWTALLPLTYYAYRTEGQVEESLWLVGGVYLIAGSLFLAEWIQLRILSSHKIPS